MKTAGVVVCGGQSQRMGRSKAWLPVAGETMLARVVRLLAEVVSPIVVVAAPGQELPPLSAEVQVSHDDQLGRGPLQGLVVGFRQLIDQADAAYMSSCDVPLLMPAFVRRMTDLRGHHAICVPRVNGYYHPLAGVYSLDVLSVAEALLAANQLRLAYVFEKASTRFVSAEELTDCDPSLQSLRNCNTPEDYQAALAEIERKDGQR